MAKANKGEREVRGCSLVLRLVQLCESLAKAGDVSSGKFLRP